MVTSSGGAEDMKEPIEQLEEWIILHIERLGRGCFPKATDPCELGVYTKMLKKLRGLRIEERKPDAN